MSIYLINNNDTWLCYISNQIRVMSLQIYRRFTCKKDAITFKEAPSRAVEKAKIRFPLEMVFILCKISKVFFLNLLCFSAIKAKE